MTPLRQRMLEDMTLRGFSARTQQTYPAVAAHLAKHYGKSPEQLSEEELRRYFPWMTTVKKYARATVTIALCGIKFFHRAVSAARAAGGLHQGPPLRVSGVGRQTETGAHHDAVTHAAGCRRGLNHRC